MLYFVFVCLSANIRIIFCLCNILFAGGWILYGCAGRGGCGEAVERLWDRCGAGGW